MADEVETPAVEPSLLGGDTPSVVETPAEDKSLLGEAESETPPVDDKAKEDAEPEGAPEAYEDFGAPEGVTLDAETLDTFKAAAKELNLPQGQAQKLVDMATGLMVKQADAFAAQVAEETEGWKQATIGDKDIGGTKLQDSLKMAGAARDKFASPDLVKFLNESKLGNHPEIIRLFVNVGKAIGEDSFVQAGQPTRKTSFFDHPTSKSAQG